MSYAASAANSASGQECLGPGEPGRYYVLWLSGRCRIGERTVEGTPDLRLAAARMDHTDQGLHEDLVQRGGRAFLEQLSADRHRFVPAPTMFEDGGSSCTQEIGVPVQVVLLAVGDAVAVILLTFVEPELVARDAVQITVGAAGLIG